MDGENRDASLPWKVRVLCGVRDNRGVGSGVGFNDVALRSDGINLYFNIVCTKK